MIDRRPTPAAIDPEATVEAFATKIATDLGIGHNTVLAYLGDRLGLWTALAAHPGSTSVELASATGLAERYVREWLAAQAAAGYVTYDPATESFTLPPEHAAVLADEDGPRLMASGFEVLASVWATVDRLAHGYATGEGVGWHEHDSRLFIGFERFFRPAFRNLLVPEWLPPSPAAGRAAGVGHPRARRRLRTRHRDASTMAEAFPASTFVGIDYHEESVRRAALAARGAGRARPGHVRGRGRRTSYDGEYDLICMFDTLHDLGDPVGALAHARAHLADDGWFFAVEPNAGGPPGGQPAPARA